jgi:hypothetical protein
MWISQEIWQSLLRWNSLEKFNKDDFNKITFVGIIDIWVLCAEPFSFLRNTGKI